MTVKRLITENNKEYVIIGLETCSSDSLTAGR